MPLLEQEKNSSSSSRWSKINFLIFSALLREHTEWFFRQNLPPFNLCRAGQPLSSTFSISFDRYCQSQSLFSTPFTKNLSNFRLISEKMLSTWWYGVFPSDHFNPWWLFVNQVFVLNDCCKFAGGSNKYVWDILPSRERIDSSLKINSFVFERNPWASITASVELATETDKN